jgi:hypothetical protein
MSATVHVIHVAVDVNVANKSWVGGEEIYPLFFDILAFRYYLLY